GHTGLDDVVVRVELEPKGAVTLLEPAGRAVDADAGGDDTVRLTCFANEIPQLRALFDRDVELPAELAHIRDARGEHAQRGDLHLAHRDLLHGLERAWANDVEDAKRAQVEHRSAVAHRQVLSVDDRRPPA